MTDVQLDDLTPEVLDRVAKQLQADRRKPADKQKPLQARDRRKQLASRGV